MFLHKLSLLIRFNLKNSPRRGKTVANRHFLNMSVFLFSLFRGNNDFSAYVTFFSVSTVVMFFTHARI